MKRRPACPKLCRALAMLPLLLPGVTGLAQDRLSVVKPVPGYSITLTVETVLATAPAGGDPQHARSLEHRLLVSAREAATGRAAPMAAVHADVAESGYSGATIRLSALDAESMLHEGRMQLDTRKKYRILVHATPESGRTVEARFDYRHHH
jgi:hypothetical protein